MEATLVQCPSCGDSFSLTDVLCAELEEKFRVRHEKGFDKKNAELRAKTTALEKEAKKLEQQKSLLNREIDQRVTLEKTKIERATQIRFEAEYKVTVADLSNQLKESSTRLKQAFDSELELRANLRAAQAKEHQLELEIQRRVSEQRTQVVDEVSKALSVEYKFKIADNDRLIEQLKRQVDDLNRKLEQSSQQAQGEVFELELESTLSELFPSDVIAPVPKGVRGGDLTHKVVTNSNGVVGSILWEAKRTKQWSDQWLKKFKEDQRQVGADIAVIVTASLPKNVETFDLVDGIWVTDYASLPGLATALRQLLIQVNSAKRSSNVKGERLELIHSYLTGTQFRHRVEAIVESFHGLQTDLEKEKRSMQKMWASREQLLGRVMNNTMGMYGDLQGIMGAGLMEIPSLELELLALPQAQEA